MMEEENIISQYSLFSIQWDVAAQFETEKVFENKHALRKIKDEFELLKDLATIGFYGEWEEVQRSVSRVLGPTFQLSQDLQQQQQQNFNNGRIQAILCKNKNLMIFALIVQRERLLKRPFNEKIELTLFRYLQDLCQHIILCPSKMILDNWYAKPGEIKPTEIIHPYSKSYTEPQILRFKDKDFAQTDVSTVNVTSLDQWRSSSQATKIFFQFNDSTSYITSEILLFDHRAKQTAIQQMRNLIYTYNKGFWFENQERNLSDLMEQLSRNKLRLRDVRIQEFLEKMIAKNNRDKTEGALFQLKEKILTVLRTYQLNFEFLVNCCLEWFANKIKISDNGNGFSLPSLNVQEFTIKCKNQLRNSQDQENFESFQRFTNNFTTIKKSLCDKMLEFFEEKFNTFDSLFQDTVQSIFSQDQPEQLVLDKYQYNMIRGIEGNLTSISLKHSGQIRMSPDQIRQEVQMRSSIFGKAHSSLQSLNLIGFYPYANDLYDILIFDDKVSLQIYKHIRNQISHVISVKNCQAPKLLYISSNSKLFIFHSQMSAFEYQFNELGLIVAQSQHWNLNTKGIQSVCFLASQQTFIAICSENFEVMKWPKNHAKFETAYAFDPNGTKKNIPFLTEDGKYYTDVQAIDPGKYFFMISDKVIDIYDQNHSKIGKIDLTVNTRQLPVKIFKDKVDGFIAQLDQPQAYQLKDLVSSFQSIGLKRKNEIKVLGNPFFDIIKGSFVKFGDNFQFNSSINQITELYIAPEQLTVVQPYFVALHFLHQANLGGLNDLSQLIARIQRRPSEEIYWILSSRVPLQLCTIENGTLVPLIDGFRQNWIVDTVGIVERSKLLSFGYLEDLLGALRQKLYIVSVVGRQSSGKSYILNQLFGTRFSVAASRCTDGIWACFSKLEGMNFLILDCEGLFSSKRTEGEEVQLLSFLAAICDQTILNQDLSFNRHLKDLFSKLNCAVGKLKGQSLFKGTMLTAVRDVSDSNQVSEEWENSMREMRNQVSRGSNFLKDLFNDHVALHCLPNFQQKETFGWMIANIRQEFITQARETNRWLQGQIVLQLMKVLLVQLETADDENSDRLLLQLALDQEAEQGKKTWEYYRGIEQFEFEGTHIRHNEYRLPSDTNQSGEAYNELIEILKQKLKLDPTPTVAGHNNDHKTVQAFLQQLLKNRMELILHQISQNTLDMRPNSTQLVDYSRGELRKYMESQIELFYLCDERCSKCNLKCWLPKVHIRQLESDKVKKQEELQKIMAKLNMSENHQASLIQMQQNLESRREEVTKNIQEQRSEKLFLEDVQLYQVSKVEIERISSMVKDFRCLKIITVENYLRFRKQDQDGFIKYCNDAIKKVRQLIGQPSFSSDLQNVGEEDIDSFQSQLTCRLYDFEQLKSQQEYIIQQKDKLLSDQSQSKEAILRDLQRLQYEEDEKYREQRQKASQIQEKEQNLNNIIEKEKKIQVNIKKQFKEKYKQIQEQNTIQNRISAKLYRKNQSLLRQQFSSANSNDLITNNEFFNKPEAQQEEIVYYLTFEAFNFELGELTDQKNKLKDEISQLKMSILEDIPNLAQSKQEDLYELENKILLNQIEINKIKTIQDEIEQTIFYLNKILNEISIFKKENEQYEKQKQIQDQKQKIFDQNSGLYLRVTQMPDIRNVIKNMEGQIEANQYSLMKLENEIQKLETESFELNQKIKLTEEIDKIEIQIKNGHDCCRVNHDCDQYCSVCVESVPCTQKAGHEKEHLCERQDHKCQSCCSIHGCNNVCSFTLGHHEGHKCEKSHECSERCQYCTNFCVVDKTQHHEQHKCRLLNCVKKCFLCDRKCIGDHSHSTISDESKHLCENSHPCLKECNKPGICRVEYKETTAQWKTNYEDFTYKFYKQINPGKDKCKNLIPEGLLEHEGDHDCKIDSHRCEETCYECDAFCTKQVGHLDFHSTHQHRNKENQIFTARVGENPIIEIEGEAESETQDGRIRKFKVGESSSPETCSQSCIRRGRAHFHLVPCDRGSQCLEKQLGRHKARHSRSTYQEFEGKEFDEVLCLSFWQHLKWNPPVEQSASRFEIVPKCNAYCPECSNSEETIFCTADAWHTESTSFNCHSFNCKREHVPQQCLEICFVIDCTGSMDEYIEMCKEIVRNLINKAVDAIQDTSNLRIAIVGYRDHPPEGDWLVKTIQFSPEQDCLKFLNTLHAGSGGDYPEAVLDGLDEAMKMNWAKDSSKMLFLIGDAPPHGKKFNNRNDTWPKGCPCGISEEMIFKPMQDHDVKFYVLKLNEGLNQMIEIFEKNYPTLKTMFASNVQQFQFQIVEQVRVAYQRLQDQTARNGSLQRHL